MIMAQQSDVSIGNITELKGQGRIVREKPNHAALSFELDRLDNDETSNGRLGILFK